MKFQTVSPHRHLRTCVTLVMILRWLYDEECLFLWMLVVKVCPLLLDQMHQILIESIQFLSFYCHSLVMIMVIDYGYYLVIIMMIAKICYWVVVKLLCNMCTISPWEQSAVSTTKTHRILIINDSSGVCELNFFCVLAPGFLSPVVGAQLYEQHPRGAGKTCGFLSEQTEWNELNWSWSWDAALPVNAPSHHTTLPLLCQHMFEVLAFILITSKIMCIM